jgi:Alpha/beta hydrolase domain
MTALPQAPKVTGPMVAPRPPWGVPQRDVSESNYVVEEYLIEGVANAYRYANDSHPPRNGHWDAVPFADAPYRTRILVVRPMDPAQFNGTVLLNWSNVSAGVESEAPSTGETYEGYAWVGVSAQEVGLYGFPAGVGGRRRKQPLVDYDSYRYGSLRHPGDPASFDIFTAAAMAVGPNRAADVDPLGGLDVQRVIATGGSQSAMRLAAYINALHRRAPVIDGFVLRVWEGRAPLLQEGSVAFGTRTAIRDDIDVPVVVVNSEFEAMPVFLAGGQDAPMLRIWEVTGAPHGVAWGAPSHKEGEWGRNPLSIEPVFDAAVRSVHRWVSGGPSAPQQPRIEVIDGSPPHLDRDSLGNALGGIRLPEVAVPTAEYRGSSIGATGFALFGAARRFSDDVLRSLYPSKKEFIRRWESAVDSIVEAGVLRPEDGPDYKRRGNDVALPPLIYDEGGA